MTENLEIKIALSMDSFVCPQCHNTISETDFHKLDCSYADLSKRQIDDIRKGKEYSRTLMHFQSCGCGFMHTSSERCGPF